MKIGLVCPYDLSRSGGVQQVVLELAGRLRALGHAVVVTGPGDGDWVGVGRSVTVRANASTVPVAIGPGVWRRVAKALADVDVVHVHEPFIPLVGWAALSSGLPTVATFHADPARWTRTLYRTAAPMLERILGRADVTAVSPVAAGAVPLRSVTVVPNGIDVGSYSAVVSRRSNRVCFLGRDDRRKGLDLLLEAWPMVRARRPDAELVVMGASIEARHAGVTFRGTVSEAEKREVLATSAILAAPNRRGESFGIVAAEAMAAGCAVVASDLPAFRHVVADAGLFVNPGDVAGLAGTLVELLNDPVRCAGLGARGRDEIRRFDWTIVTSLYVECYERALGAPNRGDPRRR